MPRGQNPNSRKQLADHAAAKKKSKKPVKVVSVGLTEEAIAAVSNAATQQNISRSELVEQWARGKQAKMAIDLLCKLESIPRSPEKWDARTKSEIYYGLEEAIKMVLDLIGTMPCGGEGD